MHKVSIKTALIAGTLDITAACLQSFMMNGTLPSTLLRYNASGVFGKAAFAGGYGMMVFGLLAHYLIALACTASFFWLYPRWYFFKKSVLLNSIFIGLLAWMVTTRLIVPLSAIQPGSFDLFKAGIAIAILVSCIGYPIAHGARHYFDKEKTRC